MSNKFVQLLYDKSIEGSDSGFGEGKLLQVQPNGSYYILLGAPKQDSDEYRHKILLECISNLFYDASMSASISRKKYDNPLTESGIDEDILVAIRETGCTLQYLVNSTSWGTGELKPYDALEIGDRLEQVGRMLKRRFRE